MTDKVHCAHILVSTHTEVLEIQKMLQSGESFSKLSAERSTCPSGKRGGDLGTFGRGQMVKEFEKAAFALQKGHVSEPVKTQFGWHLIKRLD
ncbi:MAG: peptidyl-prolyl cis-trans isomerase [Candidatus Aenigmarchaeota archaeon]|nr:peptidyl-prolyl cis-trans isomerase [Candidatus Aenigmarchaeota archaeon]